MEKEKLFATHFLSDSKTDLSIHEAQNNIWFSKFHFMAMIHSAMNKRFSLAQSIRTNILDMAVMKILMSKAWRILGFEWTVNSNFTPSPSKIGSYPLNICYFIHKARDHNYVYVFRQLSFLAKNVHELS